MRRSSKKAKPSPGSDAREAVAWAMPEAELQANVKELALLLGWRYYHTHDSRRSDEGFLDTVLARAPRLIVAELKRQNPARGRVTDEQQEWIDELEGCPAAEVYVWRPIDWLDGTIEQALR